MLLRQGRRQRTAAGWHQPSGQAALRSWASHPRPASMRSTHLAVIVERAVVALLAGATKAKAVLVGAQVKRGGLGGPAHPAGWAHACVGR